MVVPGNFPIGCLPVYLTKYHTKNSAAYDDFHCLKGLNNFSIYHNDLLKQAIEDLRKENPNAVIVYGDYYNAFQWVYQNAAYLGESLSNSKKLLEQYITGYDTNSVMPFWLFHNGQALMLVLCKNLAVVLEVLMTLPWEKLVEFPVYQFVPIQMNVSAGMEFI